MFIYKISVENKVYIGLDTKPIYKNSRWKAHCKFASVSSPRLKVHKEMKRVGLDNCVYEILVSNIDTISELALREIEFIKVYDSFKNGLNSSVGGDGLGYKNLSTLSVDDFQKIKNSLSENFRFYNLSKKWADKNEEDRKELTKHLHTPEIQEIKSITLKKFYDNFPEEKVKKGKIILSWQLKNRDKMLEQNRKNSLKGAEKTSKSVKATTITGEVYIFKSKSEFKRFTGINPATVIEHTKKGNYYKGYKVEEL